MPNDRGSLSMRIKYPALDRRFRNLEVKSLHKKQELLHREDRKEREVFKGFS
jgi:hypothetical protein